MPIGNRELNAEEFDELHTLKERIAERVRNNILMVPDKEYPMVDVHYAYDSFDLDTMRVFDKLLHLMGYRAVPIALTVSYLHASGYHEVSPWLTVDHLNAFAALERAILEHSGTDRETFRSEDRQLVRGMLFPDCSDVDLIVSVIRDRGIVKAHEIAPVVRELKREGYHPATRNGAL